MLLFIAKLTGILNHLGGPFLGMFMRTFPERLTLEWKTQSERRWSPPVGWDPRIKTAREKESYAAAFTSL